MGSQVRVGIIGCGAISGAYLSKSRHFPVLEMHACADLNMEAARAKAKEFNVPVTCTVEQLLGDPSIEIVVNLTVPAAHAEVSLAIIRAGKHVYCEKPLATTRDAGSAILAAAARRNVRVGCAPDTFMGAGIQTARKLVDEKAVGRPLAFAAVMMNRGHESWHPNPEFFYAVGGGPMFDMGPYYLTALMQLLGPIRRVTGFASIAIPDRTVAAGPRASTPIKVTTPDHICGAIEFVGGAVGTIMTTFATLESTIDPSQPIEIYGTEGTLRVPDPNLFDGLVSLKRRGDDAWETVKPAFHTGYGRSVGLADMASAIRTGRPHRANADLGFAVLDAMQGFLDASATGHAHVSTGTFDRPAPMRPELPFGILD